MNIAIVTPWHNQHQLGPAYMDAIDAAMRPDDSCLIIDNGSEPRLWDTIHDLRGDNPRMGGAAPYYPEVVPPRRPRVFDIRLDDNAGFSRASNVGLRLAAAFTAPKADAVLFLNNDVAMSSPSWLDAIRERLRSGVLVGAHLRTDEHTRVDGRLHPYLDGWCLAGMTRDLVALGGWDESLAEPAYYGDNLLCLRAVRAGMKLVPANVGLVHLSNTTSDTMAAARAAAAEANRAVFAREAREAVTA